MTVFLSYSRKDDQAVRALAEDLARARIDIWLDQELRGGDPWWQDILEQIRRCDVFLVALSANSLASKPCRAELGYARDLGIPILPVQIGPVANLRATPVADIQVIDYRDRSAQSGITLVSAVQEAAGTRRGLPDPLPLAPPVPFEYLLRLGRAMDATELSPDQQGQVLRQLRDCLETEDDESVLEDARELLKAMRRRSDVTYRTAVEIDTLLSEDAAREAARQKVAAGATTGSADGAGPAASPAGPAAGTGTGAATGTVPGPTTGNPTGGATASGPRPAAGFGPAQGPPQPRAPQEPSAPRGTTVPGWYPDPAGSGLMRFWDGAAWTGQVHRPAVPPTPPSKGNALSITAFVLAGVAVFLVPILFGPAAIACAIVGKVRKERLGIIALVVAIGCTLIGVLLGIVVYESYTF